MASRTKSEQLNIRTSAFQREKLAHAARLKNMNLSQFMLSTSLNAADELIADQRSIVLSDEDYDKFVAKLEEEPRDILEIRALFAKPSILES